MLFAAPLALAQEEEEPSSGPRPAFEYDRTQPRNILPGPYVDPGSQSDDPFRISAPDEEDDSTLSDDFFFFGILGDDDEDVQIEAGDLGTIHPATLGVLNGTNGALPYDMWQGTENDLAQAILARVPMASSSPTMNNLASRLLLSPAALPAGVDDADMSLLNVRIRKVMESGRVGELQALLEALPASVETPGVRRARLDLALLSGDFLTACAIARDARTQSGEGQWIRVLAFCSAVEGDGGGAEFRLNLLRETSELDFEFETLIQDIVSLAGGAPPLSVGGLARIEAEDMDALMFAMLGAGRREVSLEDLSQLPPIYLDAMSRRADLATDYRIEVARMSAMRGLMRGGDLADLIAALDVTAGELGAADLLGETSESARTDGVMIHAALAAEDLGDRARMLQAAWQRALRSGTVTAMSGPLATTLHRIAPAPELVFFAPDAMRIALASGDEEQARAWLDLARIRAAQGDRDAQRVLITMWPLALLSGLEAELPFSGDILALWKAGLTDTEQDTGLRQRGMYYALLGVYGHDVGSEEWNALVLDGDARTGTLPPYGVWRQFLMAAEAGRYGESLALGLIMLGDGGASNADPAVQASVISVYNAMGLEAAARGLAIEAMIQNGF